MFSKPFSLAPLSLRRIVRGCHKVTVRAATWCKTRLSGTISSSIARIFGPCIYSGSIPLFFTQPAPKRAHRQRASELLALFLRIIDVFCQRYVGFAYYIAQNEPNDILRALPNKFTLSMSNNKQPQFVIDPRKASSGNGGNHDKTDSDGAFRKFGARVMVRLLGPAVSRLVFLGISRRHEGILHFKRSFECRTCLHQTWNRGQHESSRWLRTQRDFRRWTNRKTEGLPRRNSLGMDGPAAFSLSECAVGIVRCRPGNARRHFAERPGAALDFHVEPCAISPIPHLGGGY